MAKGSLIEALFEIQDHLGWYGRVTITVEPDAARYLRHEWLGANWLEINDHEFHGYGIIFKVKNASAS